MPAQPKITREKIPRLQEDLRRRNHLIAELAHYDLKVLADKYDVHRTTIMRFEDAMFGFTRRRIRLRMIEPVAPRETHDDVHMGVRLVDTIG